MKTSKTMKIALGGICLALTVIFLFGGSIVPGIELTLFAISSLFTAVMILETGVKGGVLLYAGAVLLGFAIIPNKLAMIPYASSSAITGSSNTTSKSFPAAGYSLL